MRRVRVRASFASLFLAAAAAGCDDPLTPTACTRELRIDVRPEAPVLEVGQSLTATVRLSSCGGREQLEDRFSWRIADAAVATVDPRSGRLTGVTPGTTALEVHGAHYGVSATVPVTVE